MAGKSSTAGRPRVTAVTIREASGRPSCVGRAAWFFSDKDRDERRALELCGGCATVLSCGQDAIARGEQYGIWGGMNEAQLRRAIRKSGAIRRTRT